MPYRTLHHNFYLESTMDDLKSLLDRIQQPFMFRSIARELTDMLFESKPMGEVSVDADVWCESWGVSSNDIWGVIERLESELFWQTRQSMDGTILYCPLMASSAKSVAKKKKTQGLKRIKELSVKDRAAGLQLSNVGPSAVAEVSIKIPKEQRAKALAGGYTCWLPLVNFGVSGMVFKPDQGLIAKLGDEFPQVGIDTALAMMFEDLKRSKDRPTMQGVTHWMRRWLEANGKNVQAPKTEQEMTALIQQQMDDY